MLRTESQINRVVAELGTANSLMGGRALLNQARNLWRQGRAIEARECYAQALRLSSASRDPVSAWAQAGLAELDAAEGNLDQAFERLGEATRDMQLQRVSEVLYRPVLDLLRAKLWLLDGQHRRSAELASEYLALGQDRPGWRLEPLGLTVCQQFELLQARAAVANDEDQAKIFEAWQQQALRAGHPWQACEFGFALAEAHLAFGRQRKAQAALFDALAQARRNGGTGREYYWHSIRPEIGRWVSKVEAAATLDADDDVGQLSRREHSVLTMIAEGLANQEIAERLHISLHTVKSHAQRINSKLGVTRRAQAVVRAKSLGLVR
ncbi:Response regulator protein VraR [compost metagenome]